MIMQKAKITAKRQITVPIAVMRKLGLNPGDAIVFEENDGEFIVKAKAKKISAVDLHKKYGKLSQMKLTADDLKKAKQESWSHHYKK